MLDVKIIAPVTLECGMAVESRVRSQCCHGLPPGAVLRAVLEASKLSWALILGGAPVMLWGLSSESLFSRSAYLWAIVTHEVEHHKVVIGRITKRFLWKEIFKYHDVLETTTEPGYELAHRWVTWLGFSEFPSPKPGFRYYRLENN